MITHLSASQLGMFQRCGEQWKRRYLEGEVIPPGIAARIGTGVHKAAEANFRFKMETGQDWPLDAVQDAAAEAYDKALSQGVFISPDEAPGAKLAMAEGKDTAVALATLFRRELARPYSPAWWNTRSRWIFPASPCPSSPCWTATRRTGPCGT